MNQTVQNRYIKKKKTSERKFYHQPKIVKIDKVVKITLGGSIGTGDSGGDIVNEQLPV